MTLGRLMELYQAEQQGKQIMVKKTLYGYFETHNFPLKETTISEWDLEDLVNNKEDTFYEFFIKDEEDY